MPIRPINTDQNIVSQLMTEKSTTEACLPPMLLIAGSTETMLDDTLRYADKVNAAGGSARTSIYEAAPHVFPLMEGLPEAQQAFDEISAFLSAP